MGDNKGLSRSFSVQSYEVVALCKDMEATCEGGLRFWPHAAYMAINGEIAKLLREWMRNDCPDPPVLPTMVWPRLRINEAPDGEALWRGWCEEQVEAGYLVIACIAGDGPTASAAFHYMAAEVQAMVPDKSKHSRNGAEIALMGMLVGGMKRIHSHGVGFDSLLQLAISQLYQDLPRLIAHHRLP